MTATPSQLGTWRRRLHLVLESGGSAGRAGAIIEYGLIVLIITNVIAVALETEPGFVVEWGPWLTAFEIISVLIFTGEYFIRIWCSAEDPMVGNAGPVRGRLSYALQPMMLIDLVSFLPAYFGFLYPGLDLRMVRLFRLFRLLKITRYSPALQTLGEVVAAERRALAGVLLLLMIAVMFAASAIYLVEGTVQPEAFGTIPAAMWWAVTTLTTVGYGDVVPITAPGRIIGAISMIIGLGLYALPAGIMATAFVNAIHRREFVFTLGMLARMPMFERLDGRVLGEIMGLLHSQTAKRGEIIAAEGEPAEAMYLVISGEVTAELPERTFRFGPGDFFGERALIHKTKRQATMVALTECRLLVLKSADFATLLKKHPELNKRFRSITSKRLTELEDAHELAKAELMHAKKEAGGSSKK